MGRNGKEARIGEYITNYVSLKMSSTKKYRASYHYVCKIRWISEIEIKMEDPPFLPNGFHNKSFHRCNITISLRICCESFADLHVCAAAQIKLNEIKKKIFKNMTVSV